MKSDNECDTLSKISAVSGAADTLSLSSSSGAIGCSTKSKLSVSLNNSANKYKKLNTNVSKIIISKTSSTSQMMSRHSKCFATREPELLGMKPSYRSVKKADELAQLQTMHMSASGDSGSSLLSLRYRRYRQYVAKNVKLRVFNSAQTKLLDMQSDCFKKFDNLKITTVDKLKDEFKLVAFVVNDECRLLVNDDDLLRLPKRLELDSMIGLKKLLKTTLDEFFTDLFYNIKELHCNGTEMGDSWKLDQIHIALDNQGKWLYNEVHVLLNKLSNNELDIEVGKTLEEINHPSDKLQLKSDQKKKQEKVESISNLETKLDDMHSKRNEFHSQCKSDENWLLEMNKRRKQIVRLKNIISLLKNEISKLQTEVVDAENECSAYVTLQQKLKTAENQVSSLQANLAAQELKQKEQSSSPDEAKNKLLSCRISKFRLENKINAYSIQYMEAKFSISQLKQQIQRQQQLLDARNEVISSLQASAKKQHTHLDEMFAAHESNANNDVELNSKLSKNSEECAKFFTALSSKQDEVNRQKDIIQMLEESNMRNHMLEKKQEEKMRRMANEIIQLEIINDICKHKIAGDMPQKSPLPASKLTDDE